jgi:hypothetical protein
MKYRDNMSTDEIKRFMAEIADLDVCYADAAAEADASQQYPEDEQYDQMDELRRAALDCYGRP